MARLRNLASDRNLSHEKAHFMYIFSRHSFILCDLQTRILNFERTFAISENNIEVKEDSQSLRIINSTLSNLDRVRVLDLSNRVEIPLPNKTRSKALTEKVFVMQEDDLLFVLMREFFKRDKVLNAFLYVKRLSLEVFFSSAFSILTGKNEEVRFHKSHITTIGNYCDGGFIGEDAFPDEYTDFLCIDTTFEDEELDSLWESGPAWYWNQNSCEHPLNAGGDFGSDSDLYAVPFFKKELGLSMMDFLHLCRMHLFTSTNVDWIYNLKTLISSYDFSNLTFKPTLILSEPKLTIDGCYNKNVMTSCDFWYVDDESSCLIFSEWNNNLIRFKKEDSLIDRTWQLGSAVSGDSWKNDFSIHDRRWLSMSGIESNPGPVNDFEFGDLVQRNNQVSPRDFEQSIEIQCVDLLSSLDTLKLEDYSTEELANLFSNSRKGLHDRLILCLNERMKYPLVPESFNTIDNFCRELELETDFGDRETPDFVFLEKSDRTKLHVIDATITSSSISNARSSKISKYSYWKKLEDHGFSVEVNAYVLPMDPDQVLLTFGVGSMSQKLYSCMRNFLKLNTYCSNRPDSEDLFCLINSVDKKTKSFVFPPVDFSSTDFWKTSFKSRSDFDDFLNKTGKFEYLNGDVNSEEPFFNKTCSQIKIAVEKELLMKDNFVTVERVNEAIENFKHEYKAQMPEMKRLGEFAKIVPIPFFSLTESATPREAALEMVKNSFSFNSEESIFFKIISEIQRHDFDFTDREYFNFGANCPARMKKTLREKLLKVDPAKVERFDKFQTYKEKSLGTRGLAVTGRRQIRLGKSFWNHENKMQLALETGIGRLDLLGKDFGPQEDAWFPLTEDLSSVNRLKKWMVANDHDWNTEITDMSTRITRWTLVNQSMNESLMAVHELLQRNSKRNCLAMSEFYERLFKELSFLGEESTRKEEVCISTLGSSDFFVLMFGGENLSSPRASRVIWIGKFMNVFDNFPLECSRRGTFHKMGSKSFYLMEPFTITGLELSHYLKCHKATIDCCLGMELKFPSRDPADEENIFFTSAVMRFSNSMKVSNMLFSLRQVLMCLLGLEADVKGMLKKLVTPGRHILMIYFYDQIMSNSAIFLETKVLGSDLKIQIQNLLDFGREQKSGSIYKCKRLLGDGFNRSFEESLNECYYSHSVSKELRSQYHSMLAALKKLVETNNKIEKVQEKHPDFRFGYSDGDIEAEILESDCAIGSVSLRCLNYGRLLLQETVDQNKAKISHNIKHGRLMSSLEELATNKVGCFSRTEFMRLDETQPAKGDKKFSVKKMEKYRKEGKTDSKYRFYEALNTLVSTRTIVSEVKSKAILLYFDEIYNTGIVDTCELYKLHNVFKEFWFTLFPKPQHGGDREIAIQDLMTRINTFVMERVSEEINKTLDEEILTDPKKFFRQTEIISESRKMMRRDPGENHVYMSAYNSEDNSRWGPSIEGLHLGFITGSLMEDIPNLRDNLIAIGLKMNNKSIEIPRIIYEKWDRDFKVSADDDLIDWVITFKDSGSICIKITHGMMQGILHESSSTFAVARIRFTKAVLNKLYPKRFVIRSLAGSDDKFDSVSVRVPKGSESEMKSFFEESIRIFSIVNRLTGKLFNIWRSKEKSVISKWVGELNSNFLFDGDTVSRSFTDYNSLSIVGKAMSYQSDVCESVSSLTYLAREGADNTSLLLFQFSSRQFIDSVYRTAKGMSNHSDLEVDRDYLPLECGGYPILSNIELLSGPMESHYYKIFQFGNSLEKNALISITSLDSKSKYMVFSDSDFDGDLPGLSRTGITFTIRVLSKVDQIAKKFEEKGYTRESVREALTDRFYLPFVSAQNKHDLLTKLGGKLYSFSSQLSMSYASDFSNLVRMAKNATSKVCYVGSYDPERTDFKTFRECCRELILMNHEDKKVENFNREFKLSILESPKIAELDRAASCNVFVSDLAGLMAITAKYKSRWQDLAVAKFSIRTKNSTSDVLIAKWFPETIDSGMLNIRSLAHLNRDFNRIVKRFPYLCETLEETCRKIFGDVSQEMCKVVFSHLMTSLRKYHKGSSLIKSSIHSDVFDSDFLANHLSRTLMIGRVYNVRSTPQDTYLLDSAFSVIGNDHLDVTEIIRSMSSIALYTKKRFRDIYSTTVSDEIIQIKFREIIRKLFSESRIDNIKKIDKDFCNFMDFLNFSNISDVLENISSFTLTQSFVTLGVLFSDRPSEFESEESRLNKGYSFCYFNKSFDLIKSKNVSYSGKEDLEFGVVKSSTLYVYKRVSGHQKLKLPLAPPMKQTDITNIVKLMISFTAKDRTSVNPVEVMSRDLRTSEFVRLGNFKTSKYYVCLKGKSAILSSGLFLSEESMVLPWEVSYPNVKKEKRKDRHGFISTSVTFDNDYTSLSLKIHGTKSSVYSVREGLFSSKDVIFFPNSPNAFVSDVNVTLSSGLFKRGGSGLGFDSIDASLNYELDSHYWRSVYARKFPERTFTTLMLSDSDLDYSSEDDIVKETILEQQNELEVSDEELDVDDFDFAEGSPNDIFDLPEKSVGVHVGTRIEVCKRSFKRMLINSQLNILQALVRDVLQDWVNYCSATFGESLPYHVLNLLSPYSHDQLTGGYEDYVGFDIESFTDQSCAEARLKRRRFCNTLIVYAMSSSFPDRMIKKDMPNSKIMFEEALEDLLLHFDLEISIPEEKREIYRLQNSSRKIERARR